MNPDTCTGPSDEEILLTLAHEMAHVCQQAHSKAPRRSYHDRQSALKMREIGLQPTDSGEPGGTETGTPQATAKKASKTEFTCPDCGQDAWAKPDALLICGDSYEGGEGEICMMEAEPGEAAEAA